MTQYPETDMDSLIDDMNIHHSFDSQAAEGNG